MREHELEKALTDRAAVKAKDMVRGHVIAYSAKPMVCILAADGTRHWHVAEIVDLDPSALTYGEAERMREAAQALDVEAVLHHAAAIKASAMFQGAAEVMNATQPTEHEEHQP